MCLPIAHSLSRGIRRRRPLLQQQQHWREVRGGNHHTQLSPFLSPFSRGRQSETSRAFAFLSDGWLVDARRKEQPGWRRKEKKKKAKTTCTPYL